MDVLDRTGHRAHRHFALRLPVSIRVEGIATSGSLIDLSTHGVRLQTAKRLNPGTGFGLVFGGLSPRRCTVAWSHDMFVGACFAEPLHTSVIDHVCSGRLPLSGQDIVDLHTITVRCEILSDRSPGTDHAALDALALDCREALALADAAAA